MRRRRDRLGTGVQPLPGYWRAALGSPNDRLGVDCSTFSDQHVYDDEILDGRMDQRAITSPIREYVQADGRIRRWAQVPEMDNRFLRVVLLADGETVHNAFFDRRFEP